MTFPLTLLNLAGAVSLLLWGSHNPVLEGPTGDDPAAKRLPIGNLLTRVAGGAVALAFLYPIGRVMVNLEPNNARAVADFHTLFNLVVAAAFFPFLSFYAALLRRLLPRRAEPADRATPVYLDPGARETPIVALGFAARESLRLSDLLLEMIEGAKLAVVKGDRRQAVESRRRDDLIDRLASAIKAYLAALDTEEMNASDHDRLGEIFTFISQIEQAGDALSRNFLGDVAKQLKKSDVVESAQDSEIGAMLDRLANNLRMAGSLFMTGDARVARLLTDEKIAFRDAESQAALAHFSAAGAPPSLETQASALRLDLMRDLKQINGHIVAASAYPLLERKGELLPSRLVS